MSTDETIILKFGSSVFADSHCMPLAVSEISDYVRQGKNVIAVVSAIAGETDRLFQTILDLDPDANDAHVADFVSTAERQSTILLAVALEREGMSAQAVQARDIGLIASGAILDSDPTDLDSANLACRLSTFDVVVVPGYVAQNCDGQSVLLGRGGSDDTALFLASRLEAKCRLLKDVDGIFEWDPALPGPTPRRFSRICWADACSVANELVQGKAIRFAEQNLLPFEVAALGSAGGTEVGHGPTALESHVQRESQSENALAI